jgi:hypothetical protein
LKAPSMRNRFWAQTLWSPKQDHRISLHSR